VVCVWYMTHSPPSDLIRLLNENSATTADFNRIAWIPSEEEIGEIVAGLATNSTLETLILPYHLLNTDVLTAVATKMLNPDGSTLLRVKFNPFEARFSEKHIFLGEGFCEIRRFRRERFFVKWWQTLRLVGRRDCGMSVNKLFRQIAAAMQTDTFVTSLHLEMYGLGNPDVLFDALQRNQTLQSLKWIGYGPGPGGVQSLQLPTLIRLLKTNTTLITLRLPMEFSTDELLEIGWVLLHTPRPHLLNLYGIDLVLIAPRLAGFPPESSTWTNQQIMEEMGRIWNKFHVLDMWMNRTQQLHNDATDCVAEVYYGGRRPKPLPTRNPSTDEKKEFL
jgi:hypothetical protein